MVRSSTIQIDESLCKGCGYCIEFCPMGVFERSKEINQRGVAPPIVRDEALCVGCKLCTLICPEFAIKVEGEKTIDDWRRTHWKLLRQR